MRRLLLSFAASALLLSGVVAPRPADAADGVCLGQGTMFTSEWITSFAVTPNAPANANWAFTFSLGVCADTDVTLPFFASTGVFTGWCDFASGYGITNTGHRFAFIGIGPRLLFTGEVVGEVPFWPDVFAGHTCATGARNFLVGHGGTLLWGCKVTKSKGTVQPVLGVPIHHKECA